MSFCTQALVAGAIGVAILAPSSDILAAPTNDAALFTVPAEVPSPPPSLETMVARRAARPGPLDADLDCMAKAVYHEANNQPLRGQLAVAQVILNRLRSGRFPRTACAVVNQPGQFFRTGAYRVAPSGGWRTAVALSRLVMEEKLEQVAPGALYFHAAYCHPAWRRRVRIAQIGAHIFYR